MERTAANRDVDAEKIRDLQKSSAHTKKKGKPSPLYDGGSWHEPKLLFHWSCPRSAKQQVYNSQDT